MNVKQLIARLSTMPEDAEVHFNNGKVLSEVGNVRKVTLNPHDNTRTRTTVELDKGDLEPDLVQWQRDDARSYRDARRAYNVGALETAALVQWESAEMSRETRNGLRIES